MKKILLAPVLCLNLSTVLANDFDWSSLASKVDAGGKFTVMVSKIEFNDRYMAQEFCKRLGLKLASAQTVLDVAVYGKPEVQETLFQVKLPGGEVKYGVWGWDPQRALDKFDKNDPKKKDTNVLFRYRGTLEWNSSSLREFGQQAEILTYGDEPIKGLPAICE